MILCILFFNVVWSSKKWNINQTRVGGRSSFHYQGHYTSTQIKSRHESNKIVINWKLKDLLVFLFFAQKWGMKKIVTNEHMAIYLFHFNFLLLFVSFFILWSFAHLFVCLLCLVSFVENKSASCLFVSFYLYFVRL